MGTVFEIAIALSFIYAFLSLICSSVSELVCSALNLRAQGLSDRVEKLLGQELAKSFWDQPMVKGLLGPNGERPAYLSPQIFALGVTAAKDGAKDLAKSTGVRAIEDLVASGAAEFDKQRAQVAAWFDASMEVASEWYRRRAQKLVLLAALVVVMFGNVDTIAIGKALVHDRALRAATVAAAEAAVKGDGAADRKAAASVESIQKLSAQLAKLELPLGWPDWSSMKWSTLRFVDVLSKLFGWLLSIVAISLGAPFWFDLLNKLVNIRGTGRAAPAAVPTRGSGAAQ